MNKSVGQDFHDVPLSKTDNFRKKSLEDNFICD